MDAGLKRCAREVRRLPPLSPQQEKTLLHHIQRGDREAREILIRRHLSLVIPIAEAYQGSSPNLLGLIEQGNLGLLKAVDTFDESCRQRFARYARRCIREKIKQSLMGPLDSVRETQRGLRTQRTR